MKEHTGMEMRDALAACRGGFLAVALFSLFINLLMLVTPLYMLQVFDRVLSSRSTDNTIVIWTDENNIFGVSNPIAVSIFQVDENTIVTRGNIGR